MYEDSINPVAELNLDGSIKSRFVYGSKANVPEYLIQGGKRYRIVSDLLGSVRRVVDLSDNSIVQSIRYDEIGNILEDTNPGFQPFGYAGGVWDSQTELVKLGLRDFQSEIGRWTTRDQAGFSGGDSNLYAYVNGDPINYFDSFGLTKKKSNYDFISEGPAGGGVFQIPGAKHVRIRKGKNPGVRIEYDSGRFKDITRERVKDRLPPFRPDGKPRKIRVPRKHRAQRKGGPVEHERIPTRSEKDLLDRIFNRDEVKSCGRN